MIEHCLQHEQMPSLEAEKNFREILSKKPNTVLFSVVLVRRITTNYIGS